jgi:hypothetical protein
LDLGWQKFVGRTYECAAGHHIALPVIMDATVQQLAGYRFLYFLPFSRSKLLIEDTYYSLDRGLDAAELETRLDRAAARLCAGPFKSIEQESGVLPVILDGRFERFWGWEYRLEAYTPPAKRKFGYYALPLLWRDDVVGWVNAQVRDGALVVEPGYVRAPRSATFRRALAEETERLRAFVGVERVELR